MHKKVRLQGVKNDASDTTDITIPMSVAIPNTDTHDMTDEEMIAAIRLSHGGIFDKAVTITIIQE